MPPANTEVEVLCSIRKFTSKAALIRAEDTNSEQVEVWIPFSQILRWEPKDAKEGDEEVFCYMKRWIAEEKDLY